METNLRDLQRIVDQQWTRISVSECEALRWLLESHARLLAAAKAITPEVEQMARAMVGSLDRETDLLGQAWMVFVDQCRAAIEFAEPKE